MRKFAAALSLASLAAPGAAQINLSVCLTRPELRAGAALATGPVLTAVTDRCTGTFPAVSARLQGLRGAIRSRFRGEADAAAPVIAEKLAQALGLGTGADPHGIADAARALLPIMLSGTVRHLDARACRLADAVLPAALAGTDEQVVNVVTGFLEYIATDPRPPANGKPPALRLCDADGR